MDRNEAEALTRAGIEALRKGDGRTAREHLARVTAALGGAAAPWLALAQACRMTGDAAAEEAALAGQLAAEARHLPALLLMGDLKTRTGDDRAASSFYQAALNMAAHNGNVPQPLVPLLQRAEAHIQAASGRFEAHLLARLQAAGMGGGPADRRVRQSLDLLLGKVDLYHQQPSMFYFPGLPQRQFYERDEFPWLEAIEAAMPAMQAELRGVLADTAEFTPYVESTPGRPSPNNPLLDNPSWGAFYFWKSGQFVAENAARCPRTVAALEAAPIPVIAERSPMALYSVLKPGTHIAPHHGMLNTRLICHIPLLVPGDCALRVGSETREWQEGQALIFDDSFEHEAWNRSDRTRVILLFEIWRPEISAEERAALTTLFEAINDYQGAPEASI